MYIELETSSLSILYAQYVTVNTSRCWHNYGRCVFVLICVCVCVCVCVRARAHVCACMCMYVEFRISVFGFWGFRFWGFGISTFGILIFDFDLLISICWFGMFFNSILDFDCWAILIGFMLISIICTKKTLEIPICGMLCHVYFPTLLKYVACCTNKRAQRPICSITQITSLFSTYITFEGKQEIVSFLGSVCDVGHVALQGMLQ